MDPDVSLAERDLEHQHTQSHAADECNTTEITELLCKPYSDTSGSEDQLTDDQPGHEQDVREQTPATRLIDIITMLPVIMMSGSLPLLQFYILIAFLIVFLNKTDYPANQVFFGILICLVPMVLYANYKIGRAFTRGDRISEVPGLRIRFLIRNYGSKKRVRQNDSF